MIRVEKRPWGKAHLFDVFDDGDLLASFSDFGCRIVKLTAEGRDVVLGYDSCEEYAADETFFGAFIGPLADRTAEGRFTVDGEIVQLPLNAGPDAMHSGKTGLHSYIYDAEILSDGVRFTKDLTREDTSFPGKMSVSVTYRVNRNFLRIEYAAECDRQTAVSFTNHSYFTLNGGVRSCRDEILTVRASRYAETLREEEPITSGRVLPVSGTPFDMQSGVRLGEVLDRDDFREIRTGGGIDHYFLIDGEGMREHAVLEDKESGIRMRCFSDAPGLLIYTANGLEREHGKGGKVYGRNYALCFETERFPNAVNRAGQRGGVILNKGERYESATEFCFEKTV